MQYYRWRIGAVDPMNLVLSVIRKTIAYCIVYRIRLHQLIRLEWIYISLGDCSGIAS